VLAGRIHLYRAQSLYGQAEPLFQRALAIQEAAHRKPHPDIGQSFMGLANLYRAQGLYGQADPLISGYWPFLRRP
jgi:hypothetical protein